MWFRRCAAASAVLLLAFLASRESRAADPLEDFPDPAAAQRLVGEARALIEKRNYREACPKLEDSLRIRPGLDTQFKLADCNEHIGKLTTAWAGFLDVATQANKAKQVEREKLARTRARALEPRLPKVVIALSSSPEGLEVRRDGIVVDAADWGQAIPVDPGSHRITATAPGKVRWVTTVQSIERGTTRVDVPECLAFTDVVAADPVFPE
jgi:hypothetical protein